MASYTVQPGDSWAKIAGNLTGDQRRYLDLANANGGLYMLHPGDVIDVPDFSGAPKPVITNDQWANTPTGVKDGQVQYGNQGGAQNQPASGVKLPVTSGVQLPTFGPSGPHGTGSSGANPNAVAGSGAQQRQQTYRPNSAGQYDKRSGRNNGVTGAGPGAMPSTHGAGLPSNPLLWNQPGAVNNPRQKDDTVNLPPSSRPTNYSTPPGQEVYRPFGTVVPDFLNWLMAPNGVYNPPPSNSLLPTQPSGFGLLNYRPSLPGPASQPGAGAPSVSGQPAAGTPGGPGSPATPSGFPQPHSDIDPSMAQVADAARYSAMAIYAYGGGYSDKGYAGGNRNTLPTIIHASVAAQLPRPPGMSDADYMLALGYAPDADGNYVRQDPITSQGYGGGAYATQTNSQPATYGGYGGGGYGGFGGYSNGIGRAGVSTPSYGLVNWRITG